MSDPDNQKPTSISATVQYPKRFYDKVTLENSDGGFLITLDGKPIKTPLKQDLSVPALNLGEAIAEEWRSQKDHIIVESMILTKLANTAIDRTFKLKNEIVDEIVNYAASDLICYRAECPLELTELQASKWDPVLQWLKDEQNVELSTAAGIIHQAQAPEELLKLKRLFEGFNEYSLTAIHNMTTICGSAILTLALVRGREQIGEIWSIAHIDEDYQIKRWGEDGEASERRRNRWLEFEQTYHFYGLVGTAPY